MNFNIWDGFNICYSKRDVIIFYQNYIPALLCKCEWYTFDINLEFFFLALLSGHWSFQRATPSTALIEYPNSHLVTCVIYTNKP